MLTCAVVRRRALRRGALCTVLALAAIIAGVPIARAQAVPAITERTLRQPWEQQLAVLESLTDLITADADQRTRTARADALALLQVVIGEYETQVDKVIDRIVGDPQFPYVAAETSEALGATVAEIEQRFDALYRALGVQVRDDVRRAQGSLAELRDALQVRSRFERDVVLVAHSLSRQQIVEFATRWWNGEERAIAVKQRVGLLRQRLEG